MGTYEAYDASKCCTHCGQTHHFLGPCLLTESGEHEWELVLTPIPLPRPGWLSVIWGIWRGPRKPRSPRDGN
jgi:hypothetical protein